MAASVPSKYSYLQAAACCDLWCVYTSVCAVLGTSTIWFNISADGSKYENQCRFECLYGITK